MTYLKTAIWKAGERTSENLGIHMVRVSKIIRIENDVRQREEYWTKRRVAKEAAVRINRGQVI